MSCPALLSAVCPSSNQVTHAQTHTHTHTHTHSEKWEIQNKQDNGTKEMNDA